jgi:hypothetical protein
MKTTLQPASGGGEIALELAIGGLLLESSLES